MNSYRFSMFSRWVAALALAIALAQRDGFAQDAEKLSISGSFQLQTLAGVVGADLAKVYAKGNKDNGWVLTLYGVSYSHDYLFLEWDSGSDEEFITYVNATSFDFRFVGPDADVLNQAVSKQLRLPSNAPVLTLNNHFYFDSIDASWNAGFADWSLTLSPSTLQDVTFSTGFPGYGIRFLTDEFGYPVCEPQRLRADVSTIFDQRPGNYGALESYFDLVDFGSSVPPILPSPPPTLSIADGSVREGNKGTTHLNLAVTLSRSTTKVVTVHYATADGTAQKKSDYTANSGTLTIPAGQTQGTISVAINGDRQREKNETFTVQLSNAVGATINDGVATATILNDD